MTPEIEMLKKRVASLEQMVQMAFSVIGQFLPAVSGSLEGAANMHRDAVKQLQCAMHGAALNGEGPKASILKIREAGYKCTPGDEIPFVITETSPYRWVSKSKFKDYFDNQFSFLNAPIPAYDELARWDPSFESSETAETGLYRTRDTSGRWGDKTMILLAMRGHNRTLYTYLPGSGEVRTFVRVNIEDVWIETNCDQYIDQSRFDAECDKIFELLGIDQFKEGVSGEEVVRHLAAMNLPALLGIAPKDPENLLLWRKDQPVFEWRSIRQKVWGEAAAEEREEDISYLMLNFGQLRLTFNTKMNRLWMAQPIYGNERSLKWDELSMVTQKKLYAKIVSTIVEHVADYENSALKTAP